MIELIITSLAQAIAGEPSPPPATAQSPAVATAPAAAGAQAAATQPAADKKQRMRCRSETVLGSRFPRRICLTADQAQEIEDESRDLVNRAQSRMPMQGN